MAVKHTPANIIHSGNKGGKTGCSPTLTIKNLIKELTVKRMEVRTK